MSLPVATAIPVSALRALFTAAFRRRRGGSKARLLVQDLNQGHNGALFF